MAIQIPNLGNGDGLTGENELAIRQKYNSNFSNQTHAASRLLGTGAEQIPLSKDIPSLLGTAATKDVGTGAEQIPQNKHLGTAATKNVGSAAGQIPLAQDVPSLLGTAATKDVGTGAEQIPLSKDIPSLLGGTAAGTSVGLARKELAYNEDLFQAMYGNTTGGNIVKYSTTGATSLNDTSALTGRRVEITKAELDTETSAPTDVKGAIFILETMRTTSYYEQILYDVTGTSSNIYRRFSWGVWKGWHYLWNSSNATKDANGFLKGSSPIVKVHADKVVLNEEAEQQNVTYKKNGIGDYTITTVSGLSTDGWYIELPKDMNGNPKVAVTLSEVDGVISLKTYKRIFSMETFTFEPDLDNPLDIPDTRWIDLRLNEIPFEVQEELPTDGG